jgi:hypothetical protein
VGLEMESVGIFNSPLVCFTAIWYILGSFGIFFPALVYCAKKNLAALVTSVTSV